MILILSRDHDHNIYLVGHLLTKKKKKKKTNFYKEMNKRKTIFWKQKR